MYSHTLQRDEEKTDQVFPGDWLGWYFMTPLACDSHSQVVALCLGGRGSGVRRKHPVTEPTLGELPSPRILSWPWL